MINNLNVNIIIEKKYKNNFLRINSPFFKKDRDGIGAVLPIFGKRKHWLQTFA